MIWAVVSCLRDIKQLKLVSPNLDQESLREYSAETSTIPSIKVIIWTHQKIEKSQIFANFLEHPAICISLKNAIVFWFWSKIGMCTACKLTQTNLSSRLVTWSNEAFNPQFPRQKMRSSWEHFTSHFHCMFRNIMLSIPERRLHWCDDTSRIVNLTNP